MFVCWLCFWSRSDQQVFICEQQQGCLTSETTWLLQKHFVIIWLKRLVILVWFYLRFLFFFCGVFRSPFPCTHAHLHHLRWPFCRCFFPSHDPHLRLSLCLSPVCVVLFASWFSAMSEPASVVYFEQTPTFSCSSTLSALIVTQLKVID